MESPSSLCAQTTPHNFFLTVYLNLIDMNNNVLILHYQ